MNNNFQITEITRIIYVGEQEYPEKYTRFSTELPTNELIFHLTGNGTNYFNDSALEIRENTIRFLPQGKATRYDVNRRAKGSCIDICFHTDLPISSDAFVIHSSGNVRLAPLFKKIFSVWIARDSGYYFEALSLLYKIFAEIQKNSYMPQERFSQIEPAIRYIREHFLDEKITAQTLSDLCGISYSYVKKLFTQKFGMSPKKYAIQMKLNYAAELLSSGRYRITETAAMCGYADVGFFSKQFKLYTGLSPKNYERKYKSSKG